jgi:hypothetical protein
MASSLIATIGRSSHREVESGLNQTAVIGSRHLSQEAALDVPGERAAAAEAERDWRAGP